MCQIYSEFIVIYRDSLLLLTVKVLLAQLVKMLDVNKITSSSKSSDNMKEKQGAYN